MTKSITEALKQSSDVTSNLITPSQLAAEEQAAKAAEEQAAVITAYNGTIEDSFNDSEKSPADWAITQGYAEDLIIATHRVTRKVFSGTVKQLCQALK